MKTMTKSNLLRIFLHKKKIEIEELQNAIIAKKFKILQNNISIF